MQVASGLRPAWCRQMGLSTVLSTGTCVRDTWGVGRGLHTPACSLQPQLCGAVQLGTALDPQGRLADLTCSALLWASGKVPSSSHRALQPVSSCWTCIECPGLALGRPIPLQAPSSGCSALGVWHWSLGWVSVNGRIRATCASLQSPRVPRWVGLSEGDWPPHSGDQ